MSSIGRDITAYCLSFRTKWYFNKAKPCRFYPSQSISVDKQGSCRKLIAACARTRQNTRRHQSEGSCKIALGAIIKRIRSKKKMITHMSITARKQAICLVIQASYLPWTENENGARSVPGCYRIQQMRPQWSPKRAPIKLARVSASYSNKENILIFRASPLCR